MAKPGGHSVSDLLLDLPDNCKPPEELVDLAREIDKAISLRGILMLIHQVPHLSIIRGGRLRDLSQTRRGLSSSVKVFWRKYGREEAVKKLSESFVEISKHSPIIAAILFGSVAENRHTPSSDIDILIICREPRKDLFNTVKRYAALPRVEPHIYSLKEAQSILNQPKFLKHLLEKSIIVYPAKLVGKKTTKEILLKLLKG